MNPLKFRSDTFVDPGSKRLSSNAARLLQDNSGEWRFSPFFMRNTKDSNFLYRRMLDNGFLNIPRIHVHPAGNDHILFPVHQIKKTIFIHITHISGMQPAVFDSFCSQVRPLVVFRHQDRATATDFANLSGRNLFAVLI